MDKLILEVYVRQTLNGPQIAFKWPNGVLEGLSRFQLKESLGSALAQFGEQLRIEGLGQSRKQAPLIFGPDAEPILYEGDKSHEN